MTFVRDLAQLRNTLVRPATKSQITSTKTIELKIKTKLRYCSKFKLKLHCVISYNNHWKPKIYKKISHRIKKFNWLELTNESCHNYFEILIISNFIFLETCLFCFREKWCAGTWVEVAVAVASTNKTCWHIIESCKTYWISTYYKKNYSHNVQKRCQLFFEPGCRLAGSCGLSNRRGARSTRASQRDRQYCNAWT